MVLLWHFCKNPFMVLPVIFNFKTVVCNNGTEVYSRAVDLYNMKEL